MEAAYQGDPAHSTPGEGLPLRREAKCYCQGTVSAVAFGVTSYITVSVTVACLCHFVCDCIGLCCMQTSPPAMGELSKGFFTLGGLVMSCLGWFISPRTVSCPVCLHLPSSSDKVDTV